MADPSLIFTGVFSLILEISGALYCIACLPNVMGSSFYLIISLILDIAKILLICLTMNQWCKSTFKNNQNINLTKQWYFYIYLICESILSIIAAYFVFQFIFDQYDPYGILKAIETIGFSFYALTKASFHTIYTLSIAEKAVYLNVDRQYTIYSPIQKIDNP